MPVLMKVVKREQETDNSRILWQQGSRFVEWYS